MDLAEQDVRKAWIDRATLRAGLLARYAMRRPTSAAPGRSAESAAPVAPMPTMAWN